MKKLLLFLIIYFSINRLMKFFKNNSINASFVKNLDLLFLLRPTSLFIVWILVSIGMYLPQFSDNNIQLFVSDFSIKTFLFFISVSLFSAIFIINNQLSKTNNNYLIKNEFDLAYISKIKKSLLISSMILVLYSCWVFSFIFILIYFISEKIQIEIIDKTLLFFIYNSIIATIFLFFGTYFQVFQSDFKFNFSILVASTPYILSIISIYLFKESYGNVDLNVKSLAAYLPKQSVSILGFTLMLFSLIFSFLLKDPLSSTILMVSIFFYLYALIRGSKKDFIRSIRYTIGIFIFFILTIYPLLIFPVVIVFYLSKYYYWHRFDIHYPTFLITPNTFCSLNVVVNSKSKR